MSKKSLDEHRDKTAYWFPRWLSRLAQAEDLSEEFLVVEWMANLTPEELLPIIHSICTVEGKPRIEVTDYPQT